jgi:large subunit ribosomal protein L29
MKASELRQLNLSELETRLDEAKQEHFNLRFQRASGQLEDTNRLRAVRRNIARIMTLMTERQREESND